MLRNKRPDGSVEITSGPLASWPIGSIFLSVVSTNPADLLGGGSWAAWGTGRVPIGINTGDTDFSSVEQTGGTKTQDFTHDHAKNASGQTLSTVPNAAGGYVVSTGNFNGKSNGGQTPLSTKSVVQPYITCYMWKRIG